MAKSKIYPFLLFLIIGFILISKGQERIQTISEKSNYIARHNMTAAGYQSEFEKHTNNGYRLTDVSVHWTNNHC